MKVRKIPMRSCAVTRERYPKQELIRIVRTPDDEIKIDLTGKANGRGVYLKRDLEVIEKARKTKVLARALEREIPDSIYEELYEFILKK